MTGELGGFEQPAYLLAAAATALLALAARPAWPITIGLALAVFSGHWDELGSPVPLERVLLAAGIVSLLVRERRADPDALRTRPIDWLLVVVAAYALCSAVIVDTLGDENARFVLLDRFSLIGFVLFFVAPKAYREARDRRILLGVLVALGAYLGLTALVETTGPRSLLLPRYIDDPSVGIHFDRARGPFAEAAANGLGLYAGAVAAAIAAVTWRGRRLRAGAGLVCALCLLGTLLTLTRAIWLAAVVATLAALLAARETRRIVAPVAVGGALLVLGAFAVIPGLQARADSRADDDRPLWDRRNSNAAALRMLADRPLVGFGWGTYRAESIDYLRQTQDFDYPLTAIRDIHNVYLGTAVELGVLGALLWLAALVLAIGGAIVRRGPPELRPWRIGLIAVAVAYATVAMTTPLAFAYPTLLLWTWAGVCWATPRTRRGSVAPAR